MAQHSFVSSSLSCAEYLNGNLTIMFKNGNRYRYSAPMCEYIKLINDVAPCKYYTDNIKGKFDSKKLLPTQA